MAKGDPKKVKQFIVRETVWTPNGKRRGMVAKTRALPEIFTKERMAKREARTLCVRVKDLGEDMEGVLYEYSVEELTLKGAVYGVRIEGII